MTMHVTSYIAAMFVLGSCSCATPKTTETRSEPTVKTTTQPTADPSQANLEAVQKLLRAFGKADIAYVVSQFEEPVDWFVPGGSEIPFAGKRTTRQEIAEYFRTTGATLTTTKMEPRAFTASGDKVVLQGYLEAQTVSGNEPLSYEFVMVWTLENNKMVGYRLYFDTQVVAAALERAKRP